MTTFPSFISLDTTADTPAIKSFDDPKHVYCMNPTEEQSKTSGAASTVLASSPSSTFPTYTSARERMPSFYSVEAPLEKYAPGSIIPSPKTRTYTSVIQSVDEGGSEDDHVKKKTGSPSHSESERTSSVFWVEIPRVKHAPGFLIPSPNTSPTTYASVAQPVDDGGLDDDHVKEAVTQSSSYFEIERMPSFFRFDLFR